MDLGAASFHHVRCLPSTALQSQRSHAVVRRALRSVTNSGNVAIKRLHGHTQQTPLTDLWGSSFS